MKFLFPKSTFIAMLKMYSSWSYTAVSFIGGQLSLNLRCQQQSVCFEHVCLLVYLKAYFFYFKFFQECLPLNYLLLNEYCCSEFLMSGSYRQAGRYTEQNRGLLGLRHEQGGHWRGRGQARMRVWEGAWSSVLHPHLHGQSCYLPFQPIVLMFFRQAVYLFTIKTSTYICKLKLVEEYH